MCTEAILHFVPETSAGESLLHQVIFITVVLNLSKLETSKNVLTDCHRWEWIWLLEDHTDLKTNASDISS
jgi:hypothetical protein